MDMPVFSLWVMEGAMKMMHVVKKMRKTLRGRTKCMIAAPTKRPMAKEPWAPARKRAPRAESVFLRVSVT